MSTYLDASFAVSLYSPDSNTAAALSSVRLAQRPLLVSSLCELETVNAFQLRVFRRDATAREADLSIRSHQRHLETRVMERMPLPSGAIARAGRLSAGHTAQMGTGGTDILHVAAALELGAIALFSFDDQQRKLAEATGLTLNPLR